jgi:hypothetical protein
MNLIVYVDGGGIYSLLHKAIAMLGVYSANTIKNFKIVINDNHFIQNKILFDDFFSYDIDEDYIPLSSNNEISFLKVYTSPKFNILKQILRINAINTNILKEVNRYANEFSINENTLAVHIRLTDMNTCHADDYGIYNFDTYKSKIDSMLSIYKNIDSIYIASDNTESITKLIKLYNNDYTVYYIKDSYRVLYESDDNYKYQIESINKYDDFHIKGFVEMLVASRCTYFIYRISDYSNFCILFSDTIKHIESIN